MADITRYRDCSIQYAPKSCIPASAGADWDWWHDDYDGPDDEGYSPLCGFAGSLERCKEEIDNLHDRIEDGTL